MGPGIRTGRGHVADRPLMPLAVRHRGLSRRPCNLSALPARGRAVTGQQCGLVCNVAELTHRATVVLPDQRALLAWGAGWATMTCATGPTITCATARRATLRRRAPTHPRITMRHVMRRRGTRASEVEQLSVGFEGLETIEPPIHDPASDTMRQIVSLRMPDALLERVEAAARARGVSPSSLMRAMIAAGLDRSYAAVAEATSGPDLAAELAALRAQVDAIARTLGSRDEAE